MKVLLLGANGQLGWELTRTCPSDVTLAVCDFPKVDFGSETSLLHCIGSAAPDCIVNAAAYTAVDRAETEKPLAFRINRDAVETLARQAREKEIRLVHISTDFVFSGRHWRPWTPDDPAEPESVYGQSKRDGEQAVKRILNDRALIIRTAWLYSAHGNNFVKTMLRLMKEKPEITVIDDQVGTPTWANGLARAVWAAVNRSLCGTFHWTDAGVASWYDFAVAIREEALNIGLLDTACPVRPIPAARYPTPAKRPFYSVLDKSSFIEQTGIEPVHWRAHLRRMLQELI